MIQLPRTIGFPRMMKESGEKRVFLPDFIQYLARLGASIYIEEGYGSRTGFTFDDYNQGNPAVHMCSRTQAFEQDIVMVLRSPGYDEFSMLRPGSCLISMIHYPTRPRRIQILKELGVGAISLDSIVDDNNTRLVENMKSVAWNGLEVAFDHLEKIWPGLVQPSAEPIKVLVLGTGMVGKHAVEAATKLGNIERNNEHIRRGGPGALALAVGRNLTEQAERMRPLFSQADILVDATQRRDSSKPVVPNSWIQWLPAHAVITDLAVDPYLLNNTPRGVRGVEGIPQGNLDKYIFHPQDADWSDTIPSEVPTEHRRTTVTCYSWPGVHPEASMMHYAKQLEPLMEVVLSKPYAEITRHGHYFERALSRAKLDTWLSNQ